MLGALPIAVGHGERMSRKQVLWASMLFLSCWTLFPTLLSYSWGFQDYLQDWVSARNWWTGKAIYSPLCQARVDHGVSLQLPEQVLGPRCPPAVNAHPPSTILLFLPFGLLPYGLSFITWNLVSALCLGLAVGVIASELEWQPSVGTVLAIAAAGLFCSPFFEQMFLGQTNAVTLTLLVLAWQAHRRDWQYAEGCWLGLAAALKLFPLALLVIPLGGMRWRSLASAIGMILLVLLLSFTLFGWTIWGQYTHTGLPEAVSWGDSWPNCSLAAFWKKLFVSQNKGLTVPWRSPFGFWLGYLFSAGVVGLTTLSLSLLPRREPRSDHLYALGVCAMLLLSPTCWPHYFLMLLLPCVLLGSCCRGVSGWLLVGCCVLLFLPANVYCYNPRWIKDVVGPLETLSVLGVQTYALGGLWLIAVVHAVRESVEAQYSMDELLTELGADRLAA